MSNELKRNESTENGKKIWEAVDRAASRAPEWVKQQIKGAKQSEGKDSLKADEKSKK